MDNIYIERFWDPLKREKIYLNPPNGGVDFYGQAKDYKSIGRVTPDERFYQEIKNVS